MSDRNLLTKRFINVATTREGMRLYIPPSDWSTDFDIPGVVDPFEYTLTQKFPLGTKLEYAERLFRYGKMGGTLGVVGNLYQKAVPLAGHINEALSTVAVGATTLTFTPTDCDAIAANDFQDGYLTIQNGTTGLGDCYRIRSHPAAASGVECTLTLYDPVRVAIAANAVGTVSFNRWKNVIIQPGPRTALLSGWAVAPVTASYYCWLQTGGEVGALAENTLVIGQPCTSSPADPGAVGPWLIADCSAVEDPIVGMVEQIAADQQYATIIAMLDH